MGEPKGGNRALKVRFAYATKRPLKSVHVFGSFNHWNRTQFALVQVSPGIWERDLDLEPGVYGYRFLLNGTRAILAPKAPKIRDGNLNKNSKLVVSPQGFDRPVRRGDGAIFKAGLLPRPELTVRRAEREFLLVCQTRTRDVQRVFALLHGRRFRMKRVAGDDLYETWQVVVSLEPGEALEYQFLAADGGESLVFPEDRICQDSESFSLPDIPDWVGRTVFYQVFPDRFACDPLPACWSDAPASRDWYGGNLFGVQTKVGHLADLGVNGLYLNPIFRAPTYHAYNTLDYEQIEPRFGTNDGFKGLVGECHRHGIKVMLDGVFNHCDKDHPFFDDVAQNGPQSRYLHWFFVHKFPIVRERGQETYTGWAGNHYMPKFNTSHPEVQDWVARIGVHWIQEYGIDAWRLDVADEVDPECWRRFRKEVRNANEQSYLLGEAWGDARAWVQGDQFDATMNYRWRDLVLKRFAFQTISLKEFARGLDDLAEQVPTAVLGAQFNLLSSHDTPRFRTLCSDPDRLKQAILFQMTYPGVPCVYYGEEVGMEGGHDPDCRRGMIWDPKHWDRPIYMLYKELIHLRTSHEALIHGSYRVLKAENRSGLFLFQRGEGDGALRVAMNFGQEPVDVQPSAGKRGVRMGFKCDTLTVHPGGGVILC